MHHHTGKLVKETIEAFSWAMLSHAGFLTRLGSIQLPLICIGASPYPTIPPQNLYKLLKEGYRMSKPENCSDELYYLMRQCWRPYPRERPSFKFLVSKLDMLLQDTVEYMDLTSRMKPGRRRSRDSVAPTTGKIVT
ncbi:fibroblast growth factor receptor 2 [Caerostris darwini]|uniref:Fibroblast growth factor receptor 2 n=1 Tax=Caerostris darwini TaxID=1538125 RepID=A0AAV4WNH7_9ARAC|nr:fibroblast growth factor receptor 2 [Caerostris darwini]